MSRLTVTTYVTLDGVMQSPGGPTEDRSGAFTQGGWLVPLFSGDTGAFMLEVFEKADAFLLGRRTYKILSTFWPHVTDPSDPIATALNNLPKYVASRTLGEVTWNNSKLVRDVATEVKSLKARYSRELQVHGSGRLVRSLLHGELVDELTLLVFPVVLGSGARLFEAGAVPTAMELVGHRTTSTGILIATYRPAGKPAYGTVPGLT